MRLCTAAQVRVQLPSLLAVPRACVLSEHSWTKTINTGGLGPTLTYIPAHSFATSHLPARTLSSTTAHPCTLHTTWLSRKVPAHRALPLAVIRPGAYLCLHVCRAVLTIALQACALGVAPARAMCVSLAVWWPAQRSHMSCIFSDLTPAPSLLASGPADTMYQGGRTLYTLGSLGLQPGTLCIYNRVHTDSKYFSILTL
jgi:hypothetical protein